MKGQCYFMSVLCAGIPIASPRMRSGGPAEDPLQAVAGGLARGAVGGCFGAWGCWWMPRSAGLLVDVSERGAVDGCFGLRGCWWMLRSLGLLVDASERGVVASERGVVASERGAVGGCFGA